MLLDIIIPLVWNLLWIIICTSLILFFINKKQYKKQFCFLLIIALIFINISIVLLFKGKVINNKLQLFYEILAWGIIIKELIYNKILVKKNNCLLKKEKILGIFSFLFGIICVLILASNNLYYISPSNEYEYIGNFYFNADVHRGIEEATTSTLTHKIHPCYRFILLPIFLPILAINVILQFIGINQYYCEISNGYLLVLIQIFLNSISTIIFYKILKNENIKEKNSVLGTALFSISISSIWISILPETYAITLCTILIAIYLYQNKNKLWILPAVLSISTNLISVLPTLLLLANKIWVNKKIIINRIKKINKRSLIFISILLLIILCFFIYLLQQYIIEYLFTWSSKSSNIIDSIKESVNFFIIPLLMAPNYMCNGQYFVQLPNAILQQVIMLIILILIAIIGYTKNIKKLLPNLCMVYLIIAYILHCIFGYGKCNGIIYSPIYSWAFILLIIYGINTLYNKAKNVSFIIAIIIILFIFITNMMWIINISNDIKNMEFKVKQYIDKPEDIYLYKENGENIHLKIIKNTIIRMNDGEVILYKIDGYTYNKNTITGLTSDSNWFKIYIENDKLMINKTGKISEIGERKFFIFGMGLREKFIFTKNNENYDLIRYKNGERVLKDLKLDNIDYENYKIYTVNSENEQILIYENENGIYVEKNNEVIVLDDSVKINIPDFSEYKYKSELKRLFNEVLVNVTSEGPKPNFLAYDEVWYRDAAIIAMVLEKTDNIEQIDNWIQNIDKIYDEQNAEKEQDNLGELLYILSLSENRNEDFINNIIEEVKSLTKETGYLNGITDDEYHPVYQTKWLIYGLNRLGLNTNNYVVPDIKDTYEPLTWFYEKNNNEIGNIKFNKRWPYIYYAHLNYYDEYIKINTNTNTYPLSSEYKPSKANFEKMSILNPIYNEIGLVVPHAWSASEMFLYLINFEI